MSSTSTVKKGIIDYLWDWAETHADWAKLLVEKVVTTEAPLSQTERDNVFEHFIDSLRGRTPEAASGEGGQARL